MAETVGKISLQRRGTFYDSTAPRSFTVESEQNTFYRVGQGGGEGSFFDVYEALRCKARGNNRRGVATCSNPRSKWWRSFLFMGTCERFDVATFAIVEKKGMEEEIYVRHFVGDPVELLWVENDT